MLGNEAIDLSAGTRPIGRARRPTLSATDCILGLLEDWDANFAVLQEIVAFSRKKVTLRALRLRKRVRAFMRRCRGPARCSTPRRTFRSTSTR